MKKLLTSLFLFISIISFSNDYHSITNNGNWTTTSDWSSTSGGGTCNCNPPIEPGSGDNVYIETYMTLTGNLKLKNGSYLEISDTLYVTGDAIFDNGCQLVINAGGALIVDGNVDNKNNSTGITVDGGLDVGGDLTNGAGGEIEGEGGITVEGEVDNTGSIGGETGNDLGNMIGPTTTIADGDWTDPTIWDYGVPTDQQDATINHTVTYSSGTDTCFTLTVNGSFTNNGTLLVDSNLTNIGTISGTGKFIVNDGDISGNMTLYDLEITTQSTLSDTLNIQNKLNVNGSFNVSSAELVLVNDMTYNGRIGQSSGSITGTFKNQRYLPADCGGLAWKMFAPTTTTTVDALGLYYAYTYDETTADSSDGSGVSGWIWAPTTTISPGECVIHWQTSDMLIEETTSLPSSVSLNLSYTNNNIPDGDGFMMVGNPYAGTIDWNLFTKSGVDDAIYVWSSCNDSYSSYVDGVSTGGLTNQIAPNQGFWVKSTGGLGSITIPKSAIVDDNVEILRKSNPVNQMRIRYNGDDIVIRLQKGTDRFDNDFDAIKKGGGKLYTTDDDNVSYSINTVPDAEIEIPIFTTGSGELDFTEQSFNGSYYIYLKDERTGTNELLDDIGYKKSFTGNNTYENNFTLRFLGSPLPSVLPVEMTSFSGYKKGDRNILKWITASEINNDYFEVLRSVDNVYYDVVGTVMGSGNSSFVNEYEFVDYDGGNYYYKLKQVDFDGRYEYSQIIYIGKNGETKVRVEKHYYDLHGKRILDTRNKTGIYIEYDEYSGTYKKIHKLNR